MSSATITFNGYDFGTAGTPLYGLNSAFESEGEGRPRVEKRTYTIQQTFTEESFADTEARIAQLRGALAPGEGLLQIADENGVVIVDEPVVVRSHDIPMEWRQYKAQVTVLFEGRGIVGGGSANAGFTPVGQTKVTFENVERWQEQVRTERFTEERSHRRQSVVTINASGFVLADRTLSIPLRRTALQAKLAELRRAEAKEGVLEFGSETIAGAKLESLDTDLGDGSERLNWSVSISYLRLPSGSYAEAEYEVKRTQDVAGGMIRTAISGTIRADSKTAGYTKLSAIRGQYSPGRKLEEDETSDRELSGTDGETWVELSFSLQYAETDTSKLRWELRVSTREDVRSADKILSYEGRVTGKTAAAALAKARSLGLGKSPQMVSSNETVATTQREGEDELFVEVSFTYEYVTKGEWKYVEVSAEVVSDPFGEQREVISGFAAASSQADAEALANGFKLSGRLLRESRVTKSDRVAVQPGGSSSRQAVRLDFTFVYYFTHAGTSVSYGREETQDFQSLQRMVTYSGVAYGPSESACNALIDDVINDGGMRRLRNTRTAQIERQNAGSGGSMGGGSQLISVQFSVQYEGTADAATTILEAGYTLGIVYSVNRAVLTPIPFDEAHVQTNCGWTIGTKTVRGSVRAVNEAAARSWARSKRTLATSGGYEEPASEEMTHEYPPLDGDSVRTVRCDFTYGARFPRLNF